MSVSIDKWTVHRVVHCMQSYHKRRSTWNSYRMSTSHRAFYTNRVGKFQKMWRDGQEDRQPDKIRTSGTPRMTKLRSSWYVPYVRYQRSQYYLLRSYSTVALRYRVPRSYVTVCKSCTRIRNAEPERSIRITVGLFPFMLTCWLNLLYSTTTIFDLLLPLKCRLANHPNIQPFILVYSPSWLTLQTARVVSLANSKGIYHAARKSLVSFSRSCQSTRTICVEYQCCQWLAKDPRRALCMHCAFIIRHKIGDAVMTTPRDVVLGYPAFWLVDEKRCPILQEMTRNFDHQWASIR
jgi:hypothetical protein